MMIHPSRLLSDCPGCHAVYRESAIQLVSEQGAARLFHCACHACGQAMMALVLEAAGWISSVGLLTDMEVEDAKRVLALKPLGIEECIHFSQILHDQSSLFCTHLLERTSSSSIA